MKNIYGGGVGGWWDYVNVINQHVVVGLNSVIILGNITI